MPEFERDAALSAEYLQNYKEHAGTLRNWFLTIGGGAVVFLASTENPLTRDLENKNLFSLVFVCFATGLVIQALLLVLNKIVYFHLSAQRDPEYRGSTDGFWHTNSGYISEKIWIDLSVDITTVGLFGLAIILILTARI